MKKTEQEIEVDRAVDWKKIADDWQQVKIADVKNAKHSDRPESSQRFVDKFDKNREIPPDPDLSLMVAEEVELHSRRADPWSLVHTSLSVIDRQRHVDGIPVNGDENRP
ncbi:hypothetical protein [Burkholderia cepacia]|uniref:hypothetical protein n=1 Tax=Burkholderia cepacia TaxID=292 RepID=UPI00398EC788